MKGQIIKPSVLAVRLIANINQDLYRRLNLKGSARSIGIITADSDDVLYTALDEATKDARWRSFTRNPCMPAPQMLRRNMPER